MALPVVPALPGRLRIAIALQQIVFPKDICFLRVVEAGVVVVKQVHAGPSDNASQAPADRRMDSDGSWINAGFGLTRAKDLQSWSGAVWHKACLPDREGYR